MQVTQIGCCKGCDKRARLDDGVCRGCLDDPRRGRKWAEMAHRCRTDPEYALLVYGKIRTAEGRDFFVSMFGLPAGAEPSPRAANESS